MVKYSHIYIEEEQFNAEEIADLAVKSLLYEVSISPKAGLVSRLSNGSHSDMNFYTFINSALSLRNYFSECFKHSEKYDMKKENFFLNLRELGKKAEKEMLIATDGINTHKGTIFSMGILIAVLSACMKEKKFLSLEDLVNEIKKLSKPLELELGLNIENTNGEKIFKKYGIKGARGLALSGYDIVLTDGLKKLYSFLDYLDLETSCILLLFYYMSVLDDTNIINRSNMETLIEVQKESTKIFKKYVNLKDTAFLIKEDMEKLNQKFVAKNISPGGSADLLILTIFMYFIMR